MFENTAKQEYIPVGCIPTAALATTRYQYQGGVSLLGVGVSLLGMGVSLLGVDVSLLGGVSLRAGVSLLGGSVCLLERVCLLGVSTC